MGAGLVVTAVKSNSKPYEESPDLGQVVMTGDQVQRVLGYEGAHIANSALIRTFGRHFQKSSLLAMLRNNDGRPLRQEDIDARVELMRLAELEDGKGIVSLRPRRLPS